LHGALLDSEILAEVYLELIGGRQPDLILAPSQSETNTKSSTQNADWKPSPRQNALPSRITTEEAAAHDAFIESLGDGALWQKKT